MIAADTRHVLEPLPTQSMLAALRASIGFTKKRSACLVMASLLHPMVTIFRRGLHSRRSGVRFHIPAGSRERGCEDEGAHKAARLQ